MDETGRSRMSAHEFIDEKSVVQPHDLLQVNISEETSFRPQAHPGYPPSYLESQNFTNRLPYNTYNNNTTNIDRFPFFGHHFNMHYPSPTNLSTTGTAAAAAAITPPSTVVVEQTEKIDEKKAKRSMQQRIRRLNESPEEKELRRQKNREINRRRRGLHESPEEKELRRQKNREINRRRRGICRMNETAEEKEIRLQKNRELNRRRRALLKETGVYSTEQSRNRLRQRIKREISRMMRTGEKREDFLKETFADVRIYFKENEYNALYQRVLETLDYIRCKKV